MAAVIIDIHTRRRSQTQGMTYTAQPAVSNWILSEELGALMRKTRQDMGLVPGHLQARGVCLDSKSLYRIEQGKKAVEYQLVRQIAVALNAPAITALATRIILAQLDRPAVREAVR